MFCDQSLNVLLCRRCLLPRRWLPDLGTYREDQWCPHAVQAALAAVGDGAPKVRTTLIVTRNASVREKRLEQFPEIALQQRNREEKLAFQHEVLLGD